MRAWSDLLHRGALLVPLLAATASAQFDLLDWQLQLHGDAYTSLTPGIMHMTNDWDSPKGSSATYSATVPVEGRVYVDMSFEPSDDAGGTSEALQLLNGSESVLATSTTFKPLVFDLAAQATFGFTLLEMVIGWPGDLGFWDFTFTPVPTTVTGSVPGDRLGSALANVGDVNGDGVPDLLAGMPQHAAAGPAAGGVRLLSGVDASVLLEVDGTATGEVFGASVSAAGDVDGDGVPDLLVGAPGNSQGGVAAGLARLLSGADGHVLITLLGAASGEHLGSAVSTAGDVDGDGVADLLVGAPDADLNGPDSGAARVYSGAGGSLLHTIVGAPGAHAGLAVSALGDVNGDGRADVVVGSPDEGSGIVRIHSGADGSVLQAFSDTQTISFGGALADAGDLDADGVDELIVGESTSAGKVDVFSGATGAGLLVDWLAFSDDGFALSDAGDVDGDGINDFVVGTSEVSLSAFYQMGRAYVFSGRDGSRLWKLSGSKNHDAFGSAVASLGDRDGDGLAEIAIGVPGLDAGGADAGGVVFQGFFATWCSLGHGLAGSGGVPKLKADGLLLGGTPLSITLSGAAPNVPSTLVLGLTSIDAPLKGGVLVPAPDALLPGLVTDGSGSLALSATWPAGVPSGFEVFLQSWIPDAGAIHGVAASNALRARTP